MILRYQIQLCHKIYGISIFCFLLGFSLKLDPADPGQMVSPGPGYGSDRQAGDQVWILLYLCVCLVRFSVFRIHNVLKPVFRIRDILRRPDPWIRYISLQSYQVIMKSQNSWSQVLSFFCLLMECTNNYGSRSSRTKNLNECGKLGFLYGNFYLVYYFDSTRKVHCCSCAESPARLAGWESNPWLVLSLFSCTYSLLELKSLKGQEPESTINYLAGSKSAFRILNQNQS